jgi:ketosteroid isomerase-like protein
MSADGVPKTAPFQQYAEPAAFTGLLAGAGLTDTGTEQVEWRHEVDPDQWWTDVVEGTARTAAVIARLDADASRRVKSTTRSSTRCGAATAGFPSPRPLSWRSEPVLADRTRNHAH